MGSSVIKNTRRIVSTGNELGALAAGYVPYIGAIANVDLGAFSIAATSPVFQINAKVNDVLEPQLIVSVNNSATNKAIFGTTATEAYVYTGAGSNLGLALWTNNVRRLTFTLNGQASFTPSAVATGALTDWSFTGAAHTNQTLSTEINRVKWTTFTRQWATGPITTQREFYITQPSYLFVGASTITNAYTLYVEQPLASTNATITNNYAGGFLGALAVGTSHTAAQRMLQVSQDTAFWTVGSWVGLTANVAMYFNTVTPSGTNFSIGGSNTDLFINSPSSAGSIFFRSGNNTVATYTLTTIGYTPNATSSGSTSPFTFTLPNSTNQTASTNIIGINYLSGSVQHATGAITTQYNYYIGSRTHTAVGASTITNAYSFYIESPTAGTNITVTNNYGLGINGGLRIAPIASSTGLLIDGSVNSSTSVNYITVKNAVGTTILSLNNSTAQTSVYGGGGIAYPALNSQADANSGVGFNTNMVSLVSGAVNRFTVANSQTSTSVSSFVFSPGGGTTLIASVEVPDLLYSSSTKQFATGALTTQRAWYIQPTTYGFVGASTITNAYGLYVSNPTAGTNATITNNYAAGFDGSIALITAGNGIKIKEGSNATMGTATANGATEVTVSTTKVTANSRIFITCQTPGGSPSGQYYVSSRIAGTSFGFKSIALDTSTVAWIIIEPTP